MARTHLGDVACGVKPVAVLERPAKPLGELCRNRTLARAGHAHHDQGAGRGGCAFAHEDSPPDAAWSASRTVSPIERARLAGRFSPARSRLRIARFSAPATPNSISRQEERVGKVSVTLATSGSICALGTPTTQRLVSSTAGSFGNSDAV